MGDNCMPPTHIFTQNYRIAGLIFENYRIFTRWFAEIHIVEENFKIGPDEML